MEALSLSITTWHNIHIAYFIKVHQIQKLADNMSGSFGITLKFNREQVIAQSINYLFIYLFLLL